MDVAGHIQELLFRQDCVILPGLGGLILHYSNGTYDNVKRQFTPPGRQVTFNSLLKEDDGLLTSSIIKKEKITYTEGKKYVSLFVEELKNEAQRNGLAKLDGIGTFSISQENKWIFKPDTDSNFLESSFGLKTIHARPILPEKKDRPLRKVSKRIDRKPSTRKAPVPRPVKWTVLTSIPIILFLLWGIFFPASFQQKYTSYSGLLLDLFHQESAQPANPIQTLSNKEDNFANNMMETPTETAEIKADPNPITIQETNTIAELQEITNQQAPSQPKVMYHVIGGVFRQEENAHRYIEALIALGYNAGMAGTNQQGFFRVSFDRFMTWSQALAYLNEIKENENPSAWILKY
jgi:hypothetical protein